MHDGAADPNHGSIQASSLPSSTGLADANAKKTKAQLATVLVAHLVMTFVSWSFGGKGMAGLRMLLPSVCATWVENGQ